MSIIRFLVLAFSVVIIGSHGQASWADAPLLRIHVDDKAPVALSDADLAALPQVEFTTTTIWTEGELTFSGPSLSGLLATLGVADADVEMTAINNYKVRVPREAIETDAPIIANRIDGEPFGVRQKGPLWLVYPYDAEERYRSETVFSYSIWQLTSIRVLTD